MIPHHLHLNMIAAMLAFRLGCQSLTPWLRRPNEGPCEPSAFPQGLSNLSHVSLWLRTLLCSAFDYTWTDLRRSSSTSPQFQKFYFDPTPSMTSANLSRFSLMSSFFLLVFPRIIFFCLCVLCLFHVRPCFWFSVFSFSCSGLTILLCCSMSFHLSNVRNFSRLLLYPALLVVVQSNWCIFHYSVFKTVFLFSWL